MNLVAVLANRVGSARHAQMLEESLPPSITWLGGLPRDTEAALPERHLGLVQASEIADLDARLNKVAANLPASAAWLPERIAFEPLSGGVGIERLLDDVRIAIARDAAFGFIYPANLACLETMGARLSFFSPLEDDCLPECDALWLPGGYPELHLEALSLNQAMMEAVRTHHASGKALLAECGGMLYCLDTLGSTDGACAPMAGLIAGKAKMQPRLAALGLQQVDMPGGTLRGHTFHYSRMETGQAPFARATTADGREGEPVYRSGSLTASYMHFYFPSASRAVAQIFQRQPVAV
ncbi:MAG: cobyrinate a,c-diamide synthase [Novosphingobium sp.]